MLSWHRTYLRCTKDLHYIMQFSQDCSIVMASELLTHWGRDKIDAISQTIFSNAFSWMKMLEYRLKLKFVPKGLINNIPALVQIMAWRRPGDKPLSEPMMVSLLTHICVTRPHWVKDWFRYIQIGSHHLASIVPTIEFSLLLHYSTYHKSARLLGNIWSFSKQNFGRSIVYI